MFCKGCRFRLGVEGLIFQGGKTKTRYESWGQGKWGGYDWHSPAGLVCDKPQKKASSKLFFLRARELQEVGLQRTQPTNAGGSLHPPRTRALIGEKWGNRGVTHGPRKAEATGSKKEKRKRQRKAKKNEAGYVGIGLPRKERKTETRASGGNLRHRTASRKMAFPARNLVGVCEKFKPQHQNPK